MARLFHLSYVYDINGYDRSDFMDNYSLEELDKDVSVFSDAKDVLSNYPYDYDPTRRGRVCIVFEDLDEKAKQLKELREAPPEARARIQRDFSYVHIIPIMYNNQKIVSFDSCYAMLKRALHKNNILNKIIRNGVTKKGYILKTNKMYIFKNEEERDLIINEANYREAIDIFLKRLKNETEEEKYFVCRALMHICKLGLTIVKTRIGKLVVYEDAIARSKKGFTKTEEIEEFADDMDELYSRYDLDEIIKYSPDETRPIGSESEEKKNEKNHGWK